MSSYEKVKHTFAYGSAPVSIVPMTPDEYRNGGECLLIGYGFLPTPFGEVLVGATPRGICGVAFADDRAASLRLLMTQFPRAQYREVADEAGREALNVFTRDRGRSDGIRLHLKGTCFQLRVWTALLTVPFGDTVTYGDIAARIGHPWAFRATGSAVGANPAALLIPCHRVVQSGGRLGGYRWGPERKRAILEWEAVRKDSDR